MSIISLTLLELAGVVFAAVGLAATDAAAISRLAVAYAAQKLGVEPKQITAYQQATEDE